jgi:molybdate transport system substrate-binding protein
MRATTGRRVVAAAMVGVLGLAVAACGDDEGAGDESSATTEASGSESTEGAGQVEGTVTVLAAASLTDAFGDIEADVEEANPDADVEISYGGSSALRDQILSGQPVDVFASASGSVMDEVVEAGANDGEPQQFVTNKLEIVVPAGNPAGVEGLEDFGDDDLLVGLCAEEVPCGDFGRQALENAGVEPAPDSNEPDVRSLLDKVSSGELDAGLVYTTDVLSAGDEVEGIEVPDDVNVVAKYPIVALAEAPNAAGAAAFVDYVLSDDGQAVLEEYGFGRNAS